MLEPRTLAASCLAAEVILGFAEGVPLGEVDERPFTPVEERQLFNEARGERRDRRAEVLWAGFDIVDGRFEETGEVAAVKDILHVVAGC